MLSAVQSLFIRNVRRPGACARSMSLAQWEHTPCEAQAQTLRRITIGLALYNNRYCATQKPILTCTTIGLDSDSYRTYWFPNVVGILSHYVGKVATPIAVVLFSLFRQ